MRELWRRLLFLVRRRKFDRELEEEMRVHLEMKAEQQGPYAARRQFGNPTLLKEVSRDMWGFNWLDTLMQDLRYALRTLRKSPGFTTVAVLSLALGIGANTTIFTLINALGLRPLPVPHAEELFFVGVPGMGSSYPLFEALHDHNQTLAGIFASATGSMNVKVDGEAQLAPHGGQYVSGDYFSVLGIQAVVGRTFTSSEEHPVAVISHSYWQHRFGRDPSVAGKNIQINGHPFTVIGVAPRRFFGISVGSSPDVVVPLTMYPQLNPGPAQFSSPGNWWLAVMARLKPGVSPAQSTAELNVAYQQYLAEAGDRMRGYASKRVELEPGGRGMNPLGKEGASKVLAVVMGVVGSVLLIACANVANLLLARNAARHREIAVRLSLGCGRSRLIRQLLTESVLLAGFGGTAGLLLAYWGVHGLSVFLLQGSSPVVLDLSPDARVLAFTAGISLLTGLLFGLAPAFRATRIEFSPALKEGRQQWAAGPGRNRLRSSLVVSQVALSLALLVLGGLFTRSLRNLMHAELGFQPEHVLVLSVDPTLIGYKGARTAELCKSLLERLESIPGVRSASLSQTGLIGGGTWQNLISIPGYTARPGERMGSNFCPVGANFFQTTGIPILLGRDFTTRDHENAPKVTVVNETFARDFFEGESPLGRTIGLGVNQNLGLFQIVGVVKDSKQRTARESPQRVVYFPYLQLPAAMMVGRVTLEVRTTGDPGAMIATARREVLAIERDLPVFGEKTLARVVQDSLIEDRAITTLAALFGGLALLLACVGLYGVTSFSVVRRTTEIGVRMALGARRGDVVTMVLREAVTLVTIGVAIGLAMSFGAGRVVSSVLYGVAGTDPVAISAATLLLIAVAALAGYLPARKASHVDPMVALRHE